MKKLVVPFTCPQCGSKYLVMGYYVEEGAPCFLQCFACGFTENFPRKAIEAHCGSSGRYFIFAETDFK